MSKQDRLERIKNNFQRYTYRPVSDQGLHWVDLQRLSPRDVEWLIGEVDRLRGIIAQVQPTLPLEATR